MILIFCLIVYCNTWSEKCRLNIEQGIESPHVEILNLGGKE